MYHINEIECWLNEAKEAAMTIHWKSNFCAFVSKLNEEHLYSLIMEVTKTYILSSQTTAQPGVSFFNTE